MYSINISMSIEWRSTGVLLGSFSPLTSFSILLSMPFSVVVGARMSPHIRCLALYKNDSTHKCLLFSVGSSSATKSKILLPNFTVSWWDSTSFSSTSLLLCLTALLPFRIWDPVCYPWHKHICLPCIITVFPFSWYIIEINGDFICVFYF